MGGPWDTSSDRRRGSTRFFLIRLVPSVEYIIYSFIGLSVWIGQQKIANKSLYIASREIDGQCQNLKKWHYNIKTS